MHEEPSGGGGVSQGALERALVDIMVGTGREHERHQQVLQTTAAGEMDQQVEFPVNGTATATWGFDDHAVTWEYPFLYSPLQRSVPFEKPHITCAHLEFIGTLTDLVVASLHVISWNENDSGWFIGATVRVAAQAPNTNTRVHYAGMAHMTFQGYAYPPDTGEED